jgi:hypothetical protein
MIEDVPLVGVEGKTIDFGVFKKNIHGSIIIGSITG